MLTFYKNYVKYINIFFHIYRPNVLNLYMQGVKNNYSIPVVLTDVLNYVNNNNNYIFELLKCTIYSPYDYTYMCMVPNPNPKSMCNKQSALNSKLLSVYQIEEINF